MNRLTEIQILAEAGDDISPGDAKWLVARINDLLAALRITEYAGDFCDEPACPSCLHRYFQKHSSECEIGKALAPFKSDT